MKEKLLIILGLLLVTLARAQAPNQFSYQSIIRDASDHAVVNGAVGIQISIVQGSATGQASYVERHFPTTNAYGLVTLMIGSGTTISGTFNQIDWSGGPYFIKTETDLNGGANYTISGTSQLLSVPFALLASRATSVAGLKLDALEDVNASGPMNGQVLKWNGTAWVPATDNQGTAGSTYTAGQGINISGSNVISNSGDADADPANELQTLSLNGSRLVLSQNGGSITLPGDADADPSNELQTLSLNGSTLSLSNNGGSISLPEDADADPSNELQTLSLAGSTLSLSNNGGSVTLPSGNGGADNWGTQVVESDASLTGDGTGSNKLKVNTGGITSSHIANGTIKAEDLSSMGATNGQVLKYSGGSWSPATDGPTLSAGSGISISGSSNSGYTISSTAGGVGGNGSSNVIPKWTNSTTLGNSQIQDNGTLVNINSNSNIGKLNVKGGSNGIYGEGSVAGVYGKGGNYGIYGSGGQYGVLATNGSIASLRVDGVAHIQAIGSNSYLKIAYEGVPEINSNSSDLYINTSNRNILLNSSGNNVGIGTNVPGDKLHVVGGAIRLSAGSKTLRLRTDGAALDLQASGAKLFITSNTDVVLNPFGSNGRVGIKTEAPTATLSVNGDANKPGGGSWGSFSDRRLKKDVHDFNSGLDLLKNVHVVKFHYNEKSGYDPSVEYIGVIAQELRKVAPFMVQENTTMKQDPGQDPYLTVDPSAFTYIAINAIKEQQKQIEWLTEQVKLLKAQNAALLLEAAKDTETGKK